MKPKTDLLHNFVSALNSRTSSKKELVNLIVDSLHIEIESAYRRLSGKVQFTIREMGILAKSLDISIDSLLDDSSEKTPIFFKIDIESEPTNVDVLAEMLEESILEQQKIDARQASMGAVIDSLPVEFFSFYPHLSKFMYFKWGRNNIRTKDFDKFSNWEMPERLIKAQDELRHCFEKYRKVLYLWDTSLMWNLINEIKYHMMVDALSAHDAQILKDELHDLLNNLEDFVRTSGQSYNIKLMFYVTHFNIAVTSYCVGADNRYMSSLKTHFLHSVMHYDYQTGQKIYQWINSLKKVSSLISGSGERERRIFFKEQHQMVDSI